MRAELLQLPQHGRLQGGRAHALHKATARLQLHLDERGPPAAAAAAATAAFAGAALAPPEAEEEAFEATATPAELFNQEFMNPGNVVS